MKNLHKVKVGNRVKGFVYYENNSWWYAFGKPSQSNFIRFACDSLENGIAKVEMSLSSLSIH